MREYLVLYMLNWCASACSGCGLKTCLQGVGTACFYSLFLKLWSGLLLGRSSRFLSQQGSFLSCCLGVCVVSCRAVRFDEGLEAVFLCFEALCKQPSTPYSPGIF